MQTAPVSDQLTKLDIEIARLVTRKVKMEDQRMILDKALMALESRLKGLYAKRTVELNFKLDL